MKKQLIFLLCLVIGAVLLGCEKTVPISQRDSDTNDTQTEIREFRIGEVHYDTIPTDQLLMLRSGNTQQEKNILRISNVYSNAEHAVVDLEIPRAIRQHIDNIATKIEPRDTDSMMYEYVITFADSLFAMDNDQLDVISFDLAFLQRYNNLTGHLGTYHFSIDVSEFY